jgi:hypothetical protein
MSLMGPKFFSNYGCDIRNDSITLALNVLRMSMPEFNSLTKQELLSMKNSMSNDRLTNCAINILLHYKSEDIYLQKSFETDPINPTDPFKTNPIDPTDPFKTDPFKTDPFLKLCSIGSQPFSSSPIKTDPFLSKLNNNVPNFTNSSNVTI